MKRTLGLLLTGAIALTSLGCQTTTQVPTPDNMQAKVRVEGRLSTLEKLDIKYVGKNIPYTYSHNKIANSPGYYWWVSKHFAIKSDLPEAKVKLYLELLELSYPHYVSLFGAEPANIENQRIAVVYGSSRESTKNTMLDDGFTRGVHQHAGGETMYYNRAGYSFPSHREQHQRYIVIHETMHAFHMALTGHSTWAPNWITEGLADSIASHVYYPEQKALAVMVFDRAPMNYIQTGLKQYALGGQPGIEQINNDPALKRGLNFFVIHFLLSDPKRAHYFALFRDRLMAADPHSDDTLPVASKLLKQTFVDWPELEREFAKYVAEIAPSFMIAKGPWEQNGDQYWIRTYKNDTPARLDIRPQGQKASAYLDFPQPKPSSLIVKSPGQIAATKIDFVPEHITRGSVGLALGLQYADENTAYFNNFEGKYQSDKDSYLAVQLKQGRKLLVEGVNFAFIPHAFALEPTLVQELKKDQSLGLTAAIAADKLVLTLATERHSQTLELKLNPAQIEQLNKAEFALLANNNHHKLTPYFAQQPEYQDYFEQPDYKQWTSNTQRYRIFKTCNDFDLKCPEKVNHGLLQSVAVEQAELDQLQQEVIALAKGNAQAMLSLSGLAFHLVHDSSGLRQEVDVPQGIAANVNNQFTWFDQDTELESFSQLKRVSTGSQQFFVRPNPGATRLQVNSQIEWLNENFEFAQHTNKDAFDGVYLTPTMTVQDGRVEISANLTGPYSGDTKGTITFELLPDVNLGTKHQQEVTLQPYQSLTYRHSFALPSSSSSVQAVEITADLVVDGEGVLLSEMIYLSR